MNKKETLNYMADVVENCPLPKISLTFMIRNPENFREITGCCALGAVMIDRRLETGLELEGWLIKNGFTEEQADFLMAEVADLNDQKSSFAPVAKWLRHQAQNVEEAEQRWNEKREEEES